MGHLNGQYTFSVSAGANSNVKLYINNLMLLQTSGNALSATVMLDKGVNAMYDVIIEFQVRQLISAVLSLMFTRLQRSVSTSDSVNLYVSFPFETMPSSFC
jgi:hypothetical protein